VGNGFQEEEDPVKCVICKKGSTKRGKITVTLERAGTRLIIKGVPARVCANCGEEYLEEKITARLLKDAEEAVRAGVQVGIREYAAA
jgi:YgiT-type zinc finger domain-containing protein